MDTEKLFTIIVQGGSFISAFAGIAAGVVMAGVTKKFGTGLLASGFKSISWGVFLIASGIIVDAANSYLQLKGLALVTAVLLLKEGLFIAGTYIIVIGSKRTADKLEALTR